MKLQYIFIELCWQERMMSAGTLMVTFQPHKGSGVLSLLRHRFRSAEFLACNHLKSGNKRIWYWLLYCRNGQTWKRYMNENLYSDHEVYYCEVLCIILMQATVRLPSSTIYSQSNKDTKHLTRLSQIWATWQINFTIITIWYVLEVARWQL